MNHFCDANAKASKCACMHARVAVVAAHACWLLCFKSITRTSRGSYVDRVRLAKNPLQLYVYISWNNDTYVYIYIYIYIYIELCPWCLSCMCINRSIILIMVMQMQSAHARVA